MSPATKRVDVEALVQQERAALLRFARRLSHSREDAEDACQRAFEILMRHGERVEREWAAPWLRTVVRHEAMAIRRTRRRQVPVEEEVLDRIDPADGASVEDLCERIDERRRAERDLPRLKPQERRALGLLAAGHSYKEICAITGWTYTKRNGCQVPATASRPLRHRRNDAPVLLPLRQ